MTLPIPAWSRAAAVLLALAATQVVAAEGVDLKSTIDPLAQPLIEDGDAVGLMIGVIKDGQTQTIAYGELAKGSGTLPTADTIYEIGSATKAFTGVLLADMVERGLVNLDDPLQKVVPASVKVPTKDDKPITLQHLATHTSGLPRLPDNLKPKDPSNPYADYTPKAMFEFLSGHKLRRPPGRYEYSNYGMGLLGHLLADHQKTTYEQLLIDRIARPLGMHDTRITLNDEQRKRLAPPYNGDLKPDNNWDLPTLAGAGALRSTCRDLLLFLQANLSDDDQPLTQALRLSHQRHHGMNDGLGLGWHLAKDGVTRWHNGMTGGYSSWISVVSERKVAVVVLSNTATMKTTELGEQVTLVTLGEEVKPPARRKVVAVEPEVLASYAGYYSIVPLLFGLTVTVEDGKLMVQATRQEKFQVHPESKTKFFYKVVDAQITFIPDEDGKVSHLILHQNGRDQKATRRE